MKFHILCFALSAVLLLAGCNSTKTDTEYISDITVIPDKISNEAPAKCFNIHVNLTQKIGNDIKPLPLPPLLTIRTAKDLCYVKTNIEGLFIKYSVDVVESGSDYDVLLYKIEINDELKSYRQSCKITVKKDDKIVRASVPPPPPPVRPGTIVKTEKEKADELNKAIQNKTFTIKVYEDYYNPMSTAIEWDLEYPALEENQYIKLHFDVYDRLTNKTVESFDSRLERGEKKGSFHMFVTVKAPNSEISFQFPGHSHHELNLPNIILVGQRIKSLKSIDTGIEQKTLLVRMTPRPSVNINEPEYYFKDITLIPPQRLSGREKALNYDVFITPQLIQD